MTFYELTSYLFCGPGSLAFSFSWLWVLALRFDSVQFMLRINKVSSALLVPSCLVHVMYVGSFNKGSGKCMVTL